MGHLNCQVNCLPLHDRRVDSAELDEPVGVAYVSKQKTGGTTRT